MRLPPRGATAWPVPYGVHKFLIPESTGSWRQPMTLECATALEAPLDGPVVLHYSNCGFSHWLRKYENLGDFGDAWWGRCAILPGYLDSRNIVHRRPASEREGYFRTVIMCEGALELLRASALLVHIEFPQRVLEECEAGLFVAPGAAPAESREE